MNSEFDPTINIIQEPPMHQLQVHDDSEVKMAQAQLYRAAKSAMELHKMLKFVNEIEGWCQAKITLASDGLESVKNYLEYEMVSSTLAGAEPQGAPPAMPEIPSPAMGGAAPGMAPGGRRESPMGEPGMEPGMGDEMYESRQRRRTRKVNESTHPKYAKIAKLGREIMSFAQSARPQTPADIKMMNQLTAVGDKLTQLGTDFGPKGLSHEEKALVQAAQVLLRGHVSAPSKPVAKPEEVEEGAWENLKTGVKTAASRAWNGTPGEKARERGDEQSYDNMVKWRNHYVKQGMSKGEAQEKADKMAKAGTKAPK